MEFFELKLIEKIGSVFASAMTERKYNRYQFIKQRRICIGLGIC